MDKYKKIAMIMCSIGLMFLLTGITYAYFNYTKTGADNTLVTGDIYMHLNEGQDQITLTNIFPETPEEARARNDNEITFTIDGLNTSSKTIYYEIDLIHGDSLSGYTRFNDEDLVFDLIEVGDNNEETYLVDAGSYDDLTNKKVWVDTVDANTTTEIERTYKLRMWLSEDVIISDSDPNASYPATGTNAFKKHFASIRVKVLGDFQEKILPGAFYQLAKNADTETLIDFGNISSSTNGEGLYRLPGTENDDYPIYYYRGAIDNNNVVFGGYCWQMVRTTDTGGIKLIYNGVSDITGSDNDIDYNCGITRNIQNTTIATISLQNSSGYYYADDYEIVSTEGNNVTYRLKAGINGIHKVAIANATSAATAIPTIATNYPYTCRKTTDSATCTVIFKVDSYASGTNANVYRSSDMTIIGESVFNSSYNSMSDVGYMSNARFEWTNAEGETGSIYGKDIEWNGTNYLVIEDTANTASTNTTKDNDHHYSCGTVGTTTCSTVRYYYFNNFYITLSGGDTVEDALYKMTGNGSQETKTKNTGYIINANDSMVKVAIDTWFRTNLTNDLNPSKLDYSVYLEDTVFCNDRSFKTIIDGNNTYIQSGWNPTGGNLTKYVYFGTNNRFSNNNWYSTANVPSVKNRGEVPNIACPNETDRFTVTSILGNGALTYPVGLLTSDELIMAGASGNSLSTLNNTFYLYTGSGYATMSPFYMPERQATMFGISEAGFLYYCGGMASLSIRPVISLKLGVEFETGGDGTSTNPYVVKYN